MSILFCIILVLTDQNQKIA